MYCVSSVPDRVRDTNDAGVLAPVLHVYVDEAEEPRLEPRLDGGESEGVREGRVLRAGRTKRGATLSSEL